MNFNCVNLHCVFFLLSECACVCEIDGERMTMREKNTFAIVIYIITHIDYQNIIQFRLINSMKLWKIKFPSFHNLLVKVIYVD